MGNSISVDAEQPDIWWPPPQIADSEQTTVTKKCTSTQTDENITNSSTQLAACSSTTNEDIFDINAHRRQNELKLQQFKSDLEKKHLARREAIAERSREILFLREELVKCKKENEELKDLLQQNNDCIELPERNEEDGELQILRNENQQLQSKIKELNEELNRSNDITKQNQDLRKCIAETQKDLQAVNTQVVEFERERHDYETHVIALKDVIKVSKKLLEIRENQLRELKTKVADIETSLAEREVSLMSQNLKDEYERQIENIRNLRALYEQRQAATKAERDLMASQLTDAKNILESEQKKNGELQERISELENNVSDKYDEIKSLESQLGLAKAEFRGLEGEMSAINQLFSQILYSFNNCQEIDFDKLIKLLEENHDLLTNIIINDETESMSYAMPKVLLDLVNQVNEGRKTEDVTETETSTSDLSDEASIVHVSEENQTEQSCNTMNSAEEIVSKLPKVWRVLTELLRQQSGQLPVDIQEDGTDPCYKSVETPKGPKLVLSVSQTFIRLKDLILEKKSLEKETGRLKQLNTHLEVRLQDQEKRLETVSTELSKTWHVVGRMQRQHQQLHTHEKILRYELAQKRKMLNELKEELEYCREKWVQAREKNSNTEEEWKKLRTEFASRKTVVADDLNNSAESGYSDERECSSDEEYNIEKRNKKIINKIVTNEQTSDTDTEETSTTKSDEPDVNNIITSQINEEQEEILQNDDQSRENNECDEETEQKTDFEVQNQQEKTISAPVSLDMIDDVCALGVLPISIPDLPISIPDLPVFIPDLPVSILDLPVSQNTEQSEETPSTSSSSTSASIDGPISQDERLRKREDQLKILEEQCEQLVTNVPDLPALPVSIPDFPVSIPDHSISTSELPVTQNTEQNEETPSTSCSAASAPTDSPKTQNERFRKKEQRKILEEKCNQLVTNVPDLPALPFSIPDLPVSIPDLPISTPDRPITQNREESGETPSTSSSSASAPTDGPISQDERLRKREERLKRLEEQCKQLVTKVTNTTSRSTEICNRLETLHEQYGNDGARTNAREEQPEETNESEDNTQ